MKSLFANLSNFNCKKIRSFKGKEGVMAGDQKKYRFRKDILDYLIYNNTLLELSFTEFNDKIHKLFVKKYGELSNIDEIDLFTITLYIYKHYDIAKKYSENQKNK
jgi:hypothetical protein